MAAENEKAILAAMEFEEDDVNLDDLEQSLRADLEDKLEELDFLQEEREQINHPDHLGETVMNVVWEQFMNQVAATAGEDFIRENGGLTLDLRSEAHIQTTERFSKGKIATHNTQIDYQKRYDDWQSSVIVVKRQNFDNAMKSIKDFADQAQEHEPIDRVSFSGGFLGLGDHKVTGFELNNVVSQVEDQLVDLKSFNLEFLDLITKIYEALAALDREHISGILIAANAAKAASDKATKNVEAIQKIVALLQRFNEKLEKLDHLMDVDKAWELLGDQKRLLASFSEYQNELSKLRHLKDVDSLWDDKVSQAKSLEGLEKKLSEFNQTLEANSKSILEFNKIFQGFSESQQVFIDSTTEQFAEHQATMERRLDDHKKSMQESFTSLSESFHRNQNILNRKIDELSIIQADKLNSIEKTQANCLNQISIEQTEILDKISKAQAEKLEAINKSLEEEKSVLNVKITTLVQKVKIAYILAGGAAFIVAIQLVLNIIGVI